MAKLSRSRRASGSRRVPLCTSESLNCSQLPVKLKEIEVIPCFHNLSLIDSDNSNSREFHRRVSCSEAQRVASVLASY
jgi:hypothetical protein